ncbi:hypothetical protein ADICYQ_5279 [Cyclobacterium qasimii M12-11B]|uniref:Uncharacterized protein n=1 Tax=Cyclobacterium qasimii M12-11B TaxID=641524 RepID=S7WG67_9BACT|nr:hypothetical protein ADICYQ_5279 [Cyclobacterium qasimii M12-11B]
MIQGDPNLIFPHRIKFKTIIKAVSEKKQPFFYLVFGYQ